MRRHMRREEGECRKEDGKKLIHFNLVAWVAIQLHFCAAEKYAQCASECTTQISVLKMPSKLEFNTYTLFKIDFGGSFGGTFGVLFCGAKEQLN